ncbi:GNAT family N-acetyltransferase [Alteromonas lipolytica]|uniref:GNAT family N-acetyltransferase n=2 Tax=Alteromonas lipolytica TaxID=1856405 RepID=A0A1E8FET1_9ALTE|nr:GNAT family N-acetyltransferase [Alteromonas lipolytica]
MSHSTALQIGIDDPASEDVIALLEEHLADMYATSPPESVHALDVSKLKTPAITFFTARAGGKLMGCIAIKRLNETQGEIKSMRTPTASRRSGAGKQLLAYLIDYARHNGYQTLWLETGSMAFFEPARQLYSAHGFAFCGPFADYTEDPNSCFMCKAL